MENKKGYIIPTVGRSVYYKSYGTPNGEFKSVNRSSIITDVREVIVDNHGCIHNLGNPSVDYVKGKLIYQVRLAVLNPDGIFFSSWLVNGEESGMWDWMPYQKGQAKKTEEIEAKLK